MVLQKRSFLILFLPALIILLCVSVYPFIVSIGNSFRFYNLTNPEVGKPWVGGENYAWLLTNVRFWHSLKTTFQFVLYGLLIQLVFGYIIASLLNKLKRGSVFLPFFLIPMVVTPVVVGLTWRLMYDYTLGIVNYLIGFLSIPSQPWLGAGRLALFSVVLADVWQWTPLFALILYSGMRSLPVEPYEASAIDGASPLQVFINISIPLLKPVILVALLLRTIDGFKWFDTIFIMTEGGPGIATETVSLYAHLIAFNFFDMGRGSAIAILMVVIMNILCILYTKLIPEKE
ncbi:MAG TPA: sugar ABC transporter permease [Atribacteraceae bacterium]|nr:sugar ABC transporter permease [Atribacteraceae bacterium]